LKYNGTMAVVGAPEKHLHLNCHSIISGNRRIAGSLIGSIKETQEMLDFCGKNNIVSDIEIVKMADINKAYDRMLKSDVKYRFVIDCKTI